MTEADESVTDGSEVLADDSDPFAAPIDTVRPSQLYLNGLKLSFVTQWFDFADPSYESLPVRNVGGDWMLTDGHTRAFVAYLSGAEELQVHRDPDDLPMDVYRECLRWCDEEGVTEIADLAGRALNDEDFEEKWVERCRAFADERP
ncbi:hypothetical protein M0R88_17115 [Halorussus gelatinilyticus]|uniref:Histone acetyltransferase n=1 Tax=Halorussus gelatinilyticus TaxID=2937524 RepID=A0A8U0IGK9_9EURY|nr:hypothetical protein [Halorussus gelatinilyticus]UPW00220.1 hypothetical protein M0R88_17115 [Halorussus gelatinilyticus]